jgi:hypothetical protein
MNCSYKCDAAFYLERDSFAMLQENNYLQVNFRFVTNLFLEFLSGNLFTAGVSSNSNKSASEARHQAHERGRFRL